MVRVSQSHSGRVNQSEQEWARNAKRWITGTFITKISFTRCKPKKICVASWPCSLSSPANGIVSLLEMIQSYWIISVLSKYKMQAWLDHWESKHSLHDMLTCGFEIIVLAAEILPTTELSLVWVLLQCLSCCWGIHPLNIIYFTKTFRKKGGRGRSTSFHMYLLYYR